MAGTGVQLMAEVIDISNQNQKFKKAILNPPPHKNPVTDSLGVALHCR
jgi:hypothetical protein